MMKNALSESENKQGLRGTMELGKIEAIAHGKRCIIASWKSLLESIGSFKEGE